MLEVYKELEILAKYIIEYAEKNKKPKIFSRIDKSGCWKENVYGRMHVDLTNMFENVISHFRKDSIEASVQVRKNTYYVDIEDMYVKLTPEGCKIENLGFGAIDYTNLFPALHQYYKDGNIVKEIGTCCHNYMLHLYDVVEYYSDDNKFSHSDIAIKDIRFGEWLDFNEIDIYSMTDEQKIMFDFEKEAIYESFTFN